MLEEIEPFKAMHLGLSHHLQNESNVLQHINATVKSIKLQEENTKVNLQNSRIRSGLGKTDKLLDFLNIKVIKKNL